MGGTYRLPSPTTEHRYGLAILFYSAGFSLVSIYFFLRINFLHILCARSTSYMHVELLPAGRGRFCLPFFVLLC